MSRPRLIVGISGASGVTLGIRLLEHLKRLGTAETHLVVTKAGERTIGLETEYRFSDVAALADAHYAVKDIGAALASGSFKAQGMVVAPTSIRSMGEIAAGVTSNLLTRAADVTLKERRPLVLMVRESPLHLGHLRTMTQLTEMGAIIAPPVPAMYPKPQSLEAAFDHMIGRALDLVGVESDLVFRWGEDTPES